MCFTETTKGDRHGAIFDHLSAASPLLLRSLNSHALPIPKDLKDFIVEYYAYTATLSMLSIDTRVSSLSLLSPELEQLAHQLVDDRYIGSLCGCWLELLLLIPRVFSLGRRWRMQAEEMRSRGTSVDSVEDFSQNVAIFASLQAEILTWSSPTTAQPDCVIAGFIFQQALRLYLYTSLEGTGLGDGRSFSPLVQSTVDRSMALFDQLTPTASINTSLCWPIAVIGSCILDTESRQKLRERLEIMLGTIGLGNMRETLKVLDHVWEAGSDYEGPWDLCRVMQDHQIWISFA